MIAHVLQFLFVSLIAALVYHALRADDLVAELKKGLRRFVSFMILSFAFGALLQWFTVWL